MTAIKHDFEIEQGSKFEFTFIWTDINDVPIDLSGYTARMQIRPNLNSEPMLELSTENGMISIDSKSGEINGFIGATKTSSITKNGIYDIELIKSPDDITRIAQGNVFVSKEVTRDD